MAADIRDRTVALPLLDLPVFFFFLTPAPSPTTPLPFSALAKLCVDNLSSSLLMHDTCCHIPISLARHHSTHRPSCGIPQL